MFNDISKLQSYNVPIDRRSQDIGNINSHDTLLLNMCKSHSRYIVNGRLGKNKHIGQLTRKDSSAVDYAIGSHQILNEPL